jgi:hypothetical protein
MGSKKVEVEVLKKSGSSKKVEVPKSKVEVLKKWKFNTRASESLRKKFIYQTTRELNGCGGARNVTTTSHAEGDAQPRQEPRATS